MHNYQIEDNVFAEAMPFEIIAGDHIYLATLCIDVTEAADMLSISVDALYDYTANHRLPIGDGMISMRTVRIIGAVLYCLRRNFYEESEAARKLGSKKRLTELVAEARIRTQDYLGIKFFHRRDVKYEHQLADKKIIPIHQTRPKRCRSGSVKKTIVCQQVSEVPQKPLEIKLKPVMEDPIAAINKEEYLSFPVAAEILGVSKKTLFRWTLKLGLISWISVSGHRVKRRIKKTDIEAFMQTDFYNQGKYRKGLQPPVIIDSEEMITIPEAAEILEVCVKTAKRWILRRRLLDYIEVQEHKVKYRIKRSAVLQFKHSSIREGNVAGLRKLPA